MNLSKVLERLNGIDCLKMFLNSGVSIKIKVETNLDQTSRTVEGQVKKCKVGL